MYRPELLHPRAFAFPFGESYATTYEDYLADASVLMEAEAITRGNPLPRAFTLAMVACNEKASSIERLFNDLERQQGDIDVEVLYMNVGARNDDAFYEAKRRGATIVPVEVTKTLKAHVYNQAIGCASTNIVASMAAHSTLAHDNWSRTVVYEASDPLFAGAYGVSLPDINATLVERTGALLLGAGRALHRGRVNMRTGGMGVLAADSSVVKRDLVLDIPYPTRYGAGGADGALGKWLLRHKFQVVRNPGLANHHTHGDETVQALARLGLWTSYAIPRPMLSKHAWWDDHMAF